MGRLFPFPGRELHPLKAPGLSWRTEKSSDVYVQHKAHLLPRERDVQRIQRLMLATSWPEPIRETPKVLFVNLIEDRDHGMLDDLVLKRRNPQWPLPPIGLRNIHSSGWLRTVRTTVNPTVKINQVTFQPGDAVTVYLYQAKTGRP